MKILYTITKTEIGGAQTHLLKLIRHATRSGHQVSLMANSTSGWLYEEVQKLGVNYYENRYLKNSFNPINLIRAIQETKKIVKGVRPDVVHAHSGAAGFITRLAVKKKIRAIFTAHGWSFTDGVPLLRKYIALWAEKLVSKYTDVIICVSKNDERLALKYEIAPTQKIKQIYNFVEIPQTQVNQDTSHPNILFVGRLAPPKDLEVLFEAVSNIDSLIQNTATITIVGDGSMKHVFEESAKKHNIDVVWCGLLSHDDVLQAFQNAHIFVLPTHWEGFPMTILEAMSFGLPVVASGVGGIPEIVSERVGFCVSKRSQVKEFTHALAKLISNPGLRKEKGFQAREFVIQNFSEEKGLKETFSLYAA